MSTSPAVLSLIKHSDKELQSFLFEHAREGGNSVALWRLPDSELTHVIVSRGHQLIDHDALLEEMDQGFLMAPFDKGSKRFFLPADRFFTFQNGNLKMRGPLEERSVEWLHDQLAGKPPRKNFAASPVGVIALSDQAKAAFIQTIRECLREIGNGTFEKIVPSRRRTVSLPESFDLVDSFHRLCRQYPKALISIVSIPDVGTWLGASPEVLVCVRDKSIFQTVALAGTLPYEPGIDIRSVAWTQKEIEEQALVERYVISCFKKVRLREYEEHGPKTVIAGNLMHLKSEFKVDIKATNFPQIGSVMLGLLHPTSAVCGMPLETSLLFLKEHEDYDRGFYAGYLGPVNVHNDIELFVNLRCMQISGGTGILYAGAGVTVDSIPEKEWDETEMKFNTLLNVIF
jgi:isochorismate synthase